MRSRLAPLAVLFIVVLAAACAPPPETPEIVLPRADLRKAFVEAMRTEARDANAGWGYLEAVDLAVAQADEPWAFATLAASLDALVERESASMTAGIGHALAHRSVEALVEVVRRLKRAFDDARHAGPSGPLMRPMIATALHDLALRIGNPRAARRWRKRMGCAMEATVVGPLDATPLAGLSNPVPIKAQGAMPESLPGVPPFAAEVYPERVEGDACALDLGQLSRLRGVYALVIDLDVPRTERVWVVLDTSAASEVELAGMSLLSRSAAAGAQHTTSIGSARVNGGRARLVARVAATGEPPRLALRIWGEDGHPIAVHAPAADDEAVATRAEGDSPNPALVPAPTNEEELVVAAASRLALGQARLAAELLEGKDAPPPAESDELVDLLRIRALQEARELPRTHALLEVTAAASRVKQRCPDCWEARLVAAAAAHERSGRGAGAYEALKALGVSLTPQPAEADAGDGTGGAAGGGDEAADSGGEASATSDATGTGGAAAATVAESDWRERLSAVELAYVATLANRYALGDLARQAYDALAERAPGSAMLADVDADIHERIGDDRIDAACSGGTNRATTSCMRAYLDRGDFDQALAELGRLRALRGSTGIYQDIELRVLLERGRIEDALSLYRQIPPGRRLLSVLGIAWQRPEQDEAKDMFAEDMLRARDAPYAFEPLARLLGITPDRVPELEAEGRALVAADRAQAFLPGAATAVLRHLEDLSLDASGLLTFWVYDLRRVSGTTDVAGGVASSAPSIMGRATQRTLRRRIFKADGRVLDPDPEARGAQGHTELSQLEQGDYVEELVAGFALPDDSGQLVVDTTDLLPRRTSMREAEIRFSRPRSLPLRVWTHAMLGPGETKDDGERQTSVWRIDNQAPRRIEEGVPPLEARVGLSFGSESWERIARAVADKLASLDDRDPEAAHSYLERWIEKELGDAKLPPREALSRLVAAVGRTITRADASELSDVSATLGGTSSQARYFLEQGSGSRSWVIHRALAELGIASEIALAEVTPSSAAENFPPRAGRFRHPLVRAEVDGEKLWIDADVDGPPLPPGIVSNELRGRTALLHTGEMVRVETAGDVPGDEIDVRLSVDEKGDAHGTFAAVLSGRAAQKLGEAFETVVGSSRTELLRNVVLGWLPWADVHDVTLSSEEGAWQVGVRANVDIVGFARPEGAERPARRGGASPAGSMVYTLPGVEPFHAVYPRPSATTLADRYTAQNDRTGALAIDLPQLYHVRRRIELAPGYAITREPPPIAVSAPELQAKRIIRVQGSVIEEDFELNLPVGTVALDAFEPFVRNVRAVDDAFLFGIGVSK